MNHFLTLLPVAYVAAFVITIVSCDMMEVKIPTKWFNAGFVGLFVAVLLVGILPLLFGPGGPF